MTTTVKASLPAQVIDQILGGDEYALARHAQEAANTSMDVEEEKKAKPGEAKPPTTELPRLVFSVTSLDGGACDALPPSLRHARPLVRGNQDSSAKESPAKDGMDVEGDEAKHDDPMQREVDDALSTLMGRLSLNDRGTMASPSALLAYVNTTHEGRELTAAGVLAATPTLVGVLDRANVPAIAAHIANLHRVQTAATRMEMRVSNWQFPLMMDASPVACLMQPKLINAAMTSSMRLIDSLHQLRGLYGAMDGIITSREHDNVDGMFRLNYSALESWWERTRRAFCTVKEQNGQPLWRVLWTPPAVGSGITAWEPADVCALPLMVRQAVRMRFQQLLIEYTWRTVHLYECYTLALSGALAAREERPLEYPDFSVARTERDLYWMPVSAAHQQLLSPAPRVSPIALGDRLEHLGLHTGVSGTVLLVEQLNWLWNKLPLLRDPGIVEGYMPLSEAVRSVMYQYEQAFAEEEADQSHSQKPDNRKRRQRKARKHEARARQARDAVLQLLEGMTAAERSALREEVVLLVLQIAAMDCGQLEHAAIVAAQMRQKMMPGAPTPPKPASPAKPPSGDANSDQENRGSDRMEE